MAKKKQVAKKKQRSYVDNQGETMELDEEWFRTATVFGQDLPRQSIPISVENQHQGHAGSTNASMQRKNKP